MNLHAWLRWCSMIPNVHITVRQNGFRINVMRPAVNKGSRLWILSICLTCEQIDGQALIFFHLLPLSSLTRGSVAQLPRCGRKMGGQLWTQLPKGHMSSRFRRVLWRHARTWLLKWPAGHQKWHNTNAETHQHSNHTHLLPPKGNRITLTNYFLNLNLLRLLR